jgi:CheY-like chemotaxis protein
MKDVASRFVILLGEDEPADAHLVKTALAENRILAELYWVQDGREVMEFLHHQGAKFVDSPRPDLILLDLNMPRMDGRECLAEIKKDEYFRDIPVVILTTSSVQRDVLVSYELGAAGFITKPVDVHQFIDVIRQLGDYWLTLVRLPKRH